MTARNIARADSSDAPPSAGTEANEAASTAAAQRCASTMWPVSTATQAAKTANGGWFSTPESPTVESHRCTVVIWPAP